MNQEIIMHMMFFIYNTFLIIFTVLFSPLILLLFLLKPKYRAGFFVKTGFYPKIKDARPSVLFHAVSVGEVNAVEGLIKRFKKDFPGFRIILTTVTKTGQEVAKDKLGSTADLITYFPYDFPFSVNAALDALSPKAVIIAETEIWPNFSKYANKKNIPLIIVNGRISPSSYKNYSKLSFFFKKILSFYSLILMQSKTDAQRIIDIGADKDKVEVMGNLKFDIENLMSFEETEQLKAALELNGKKLILAGSTHKGEDEIILEVFKKLHAKHPELRLMIAPRHPERNISVLKLIADSGFNFGLRSKRSNFTDNQIILLDTMGELGKLYSAAYASFIGGSFSGTGGHNPLESCIYNVPVLSGPTVFNFKDIYEYLTSNGAAQIVKNGNELYCAFDKLLSQPEAYNLASLSCSEIFSANRGALDYFLDKIKHFLI